MNKLSSEDTKDLLMEFKNDIKIKDFIKARVILSYFESVNEKTQQTLLFELSKADYDFSIPLYAFLISKFENFSKKYSQIEELIVFQLIDNPDLICKFLKDDLIDDKTIFIKVAGELRLEQSVDIFLNLLTNSNDTKTIKEVIISLGLIGDPISVKKLTDFLYAPDKEIVKIAINAIGQIATPTAMYRLSEKMGQNIEIDSQILNVFSNVQDRISLEKINDTLRSHHAYLRNLAVDILTNIGSKAVPILIDNLNYNDPDIQVHSINVLGQIKDPSAIYPIRKLLANNPNDPNVRFAAYEALTTLAFNKGTYILAKGLSDKVEHVRIAAAKAIDSHFNDILCAGIKNIIKSKDQESYLTVKAIVDAQADNIFSGLISEESFQELAASYLSKSHNDIKNRYYKLSYKLGYSDFGKKIIPNRNGFVKKLRACAIDDSKMVLTIYKNTLHQLNFEPVLFQSPQLALNWLKEEKPDIIFLDLNMPEMNGIELTKKIREIYKKDELPIIMVTTQRDVFSIDSPYNAGVSRIINKPFSLQKLQEVIDML